MRKGLSMQDMSAYVLALVVVAVILGVGATILTQVQTTQTSGTTAYNATGYGLTGTGTLSQWLPIIAVIVAAAVVIGVIVSAFRG
jgi:hypothetical protein